MFLLNRNMWLTVAIATMLAGAPLLAQLATPNEEQLRQKLGELKSTLAIVSKSQPLQNRVCDSEVYSHATEWALKYDLPLSESDRKRLDTALNHGFVRARALATTHAELPWAQQKGHIVRGYVSRVDGSVQPYGMVIPAGYRSGIPIRLDVVLHGSSRPLGTSEVRFIEGFDRDPANPDTAPNVPYIELHPLGRVENCYRWAGEADVFEAIEDACRCYSINRDQIVLRGMSMGASGTWHLGLKHPDFFVALGPYCGYVDTHLFSETPGMNFVKVGPLPQVQELGLHMLDSIDYAANAGVVPEIACIGEIDPFFQAHVIMKAAMQREGLQMVNLISPGTAHVQDPVTWAKEMALIQPIAEKGVQHSQPHLRFVTWTLKYSRCHWVQLLRLQKHYQRAEFVGDRSPHGDIAIHKLKNISAFSLQFPDASAHTVSIEGQQFTLHPVKSATHTYNATFALNAANRWHGHFRWGSSCRQTARSSRADRRCLLAAIPLCNRHGHAVECKCPHVGC